MYVAKTTDVSKDKKTITIEYARKKLGKKAEKMTDQQINDLLIALHSLCNKTIDSVIKLYENAK